MAVTIRSAANRSEDSCQNMMRILVFACAMIAFSCSAVGLVNGSFETNGKDPATWRFPGISDLNIPAGSSEITGWNITGQAVDYVTDWNAFDGKALVDLAASPGEGGINQTFTTITGHTYTINFEISGNPNPEPFLTTNPVKTMNVNAGNVSTAFSYNVQQMGNTTSNLKWQPESISFTATSSSATVSFSDATGANFYTGSLIDAVSVSDVTATPLPPGAATGGICLATLALGLGARRSLAAH